MNAAYWSFARRATPHVVCPFLDGNWKKAPFDFVDPPVPTKPEHLLAPELRSTPRSEDPAFALNNYVMRGGPPVIFDPRTMGFSMNPFDLLPTRTWRQLFPFAVAREKDGTWRLTITTAPWRAVKPGRVQLDPVEVEVPLFTGMRRGRDELNRSVSIMDFTNAVLRTPPLTLTVSEPPVKGRPTSWCGAISSNLTVSAMLSTNICAAGVPLMFTLEIAGAVNPSSVRPPDDFTSAFAGTVFQMDAGSLKTETQGDVRRFKWRVKPLKPGTVEFPAFPVSCFDVGRQSYVTRKTSPIPIQVVAGQQAVLTEENDELPQPDGIDLDLRGAESRPLLPHLPVSLILFLLSPVLFLGVRFAPPVRRRIAASNAAYRRARAFGICRRALKSPDAARRAAAIRRFFTVRYGVVGAAVTAADAQRLMAPDYTEEEIALVVVNLQAQDARNFSTKPGVGVIALLIAAGLCLGVSARAEEDAARAAFSYRRASSLAVQATDEAGFRLAADAYRDCLDAGADNAPLYQNLGACLVMAGDVRAARAAFDCAERRAGETPSTVRGLTAALAKQTNNPQAELSPARFFLRPHVSWSVDTRLIIAAALWALLWLALLIPAGALRRFLLTVLFIAFSAAAISVGVSLVEELHAKEVIHAQK